MLTFFRRIRKGLLDGGATSKYVLYALGEIALVVIGILIALQINKWNQNKLNDRILDDYLNSLIIDLENDISLYEKSLDFTVARINAVRYLLLILETPKENISKDSLINNLNLSIWLESLNNISPTYNDLLNTGKLRLVNPISLRRKIQDYYQGLEDVKSAMTTNDRVYMDNIVPFTMKHYSWNNVIKNPTFEGVYKMPKTSRSLLSPWDHSYNSPEMIEFENILSWRHVDLNMEIVRYRHLMDDAKLLIYEIEKVLD